MKKLIAAMAALAMLAAISTTALAADVPFTASTPATGTASVQTATTQTDKYSATIDWGDMTFLYNFGTWSVTDHTWSGAGWDNTKFDGTKDLVKVTNDSSQPINADFSYAKDSATGGVTTGTFTKVTGNANDTTVAGTTGPTGTMALDLCSVGATGTAIPFGNTYLNLQGRPVASIGTTAAKIGTITVTLSSSPTGATTELAKVTDAVVATVPYGTVNTQVAVEAAMIAKAQAVVATGYTVAISTGSTYTVGTNAWAGEFIVTNNNNVTNTKTDATSRNITVVIAAS
jgi:hypothetical protein